MNIYAKRGDKVVFLGKNGSDSDLSKALKHLKSGQRYTVDQTEVGSWHTDVFLQEATGIAFNSVCFEDAVEDKGKYLKMAEEMGKSQTTTVVKDLAVAHTPLNMQILLDAAAKVRRTGFIYVIESKMIPDDAYGILYVRPEDSKDWKKNGT